MNFNGCQTKSCKTAKYPAIGHPVIYPTLGLVNGAAKGGLPCHFCVILFHPNAIIKNTVAVSTIAAPEAMLR